MAVKRMPTTLIALAILGAVGASMFTLILGGLWLLNLAMHYAGF